MATLTPTPTRVSLYAAIMATPANTPERRAAVARWSRVAFHSDPMTRRAVIRGANAHGCSGCDATLRNPRHTLCAACAEDAGYGHRAR